MKLKPGIIRFAFAFLIVISSCGENLEKENAELWDRIGELQKKIDELDSVAATKSELSADKGELSAEDSRLEEGIAELQVEVDDLNSIIATKDELSAGNAKLQREVEQLQAEIERLSSANNRIEKDISELQTELDDLSSVIPLGIVNQIDAAEMVFVPAGKFIMGTSDAQLEKIVQGISRLREQFRHEQPQHTVYLDSFYIDKYEITNAQFERFVNATSYVTDAEREGWGYVWEGFDVWPRISGADWRHPVGPGSGIRNRMDHPVVQTSYRDAVVYAKWAGKRLATEAEWEKAARGTDGRIFPWGNTWLSTRLNSLEAGPYTTTAVGSYPEGASPYGALDMAGNIWEWVEDWYHPTWYDRPPNVSNPRGPNQGKHRVFRGACWMNKRTVARCSHRDNYVSIPSFRVQLGGFRCAKDVSP